MENIRLDSAVGAEGDCSFRTTHWSVVLLAGHADSHESGAALETLCRTYWYPLYAYARRYGLSPHDAQDATQGFFAHLIEKAIVARADPQRGRFRSFLLTSFKNHLGQERLRANAQKRGGGASVISLDETVAEDRYAREPADPHSPDELFERRWAVTLVETVLQKLESAYARDGKAEQFGHLRPFLTGEQGSYIELSAGLGGTEGAARVAVHRLRQRYHEFFRAEVAQTVTSPEELEEELRHICRVLSG